MSIRTFPLVTATIVCWNHSSHLNRCIGSLRAQDYPALEIIVVDNASTDNSREILSGMSNVRLILNDENRGFSISQNIAIAAAKGEWILCLNPDTRLEMNFVSELVKAGSLHDRIGMVCPKILRMRKDGSTSQPPLLDSTGCYFTSVLRHHDRGSQQPDNGQYNTPEYVFGYTGAAVLFRRAMIDDISVEGEFMDEDFFFYREDADLSWRANLLGWQCLYTPYAVGYHVRTVFEDNRADLNSRVNMHSTKNRFLMRIKNIQPAVYVKVLIPTTIRDLGILGYVIFKERTSVPGLIWIFKNWRKMWAKRQWIQKRVRVPASEIASWFSYEPVSKPLENKCLTELAKGPVSVL